jgi:hypothetical protein
MYKTARNTTSNKTDSGTWVPNGRDNNHKSNREQCDGYQDEGHLDDWPTEIGGICVRLGTNSEVEEPNKCEENNCILDDSWGSLLVEMNSSCRVLGCSPMRETREPTSPAKTNAEVTKALKMIPDLWLVLAL